MTKPDPKTNAEPETATRLTKHGQAVPASELLPLIYDDLRSLARRQIGSGERTLQATSLVHEAWLRVVGTEDPGWECRAHFYGAAARAMRRILVEQARRRGRLRHGATLRKSALDSELPEVTCGLPMEDLLTLDEALEELEERSSVQARIVMLRFFAGLRMEDIAELLGLKLKRVEREWTFARTWLEQRLRPLDGEDESR